MGKESLCLNWLLTLYVLGLCNVCIPTLQCHLRSIIKDIFDVKELANSINRSQELPTRKRRRLCPLGSDNKTSKQCNKYARPICGQHVNIIVKIVLYYIAIM